jgi:hypothetical protein
LYVFKNKTKGSVKIVHEIWPMLGVYGTLTIKEDAARKWYEDVYVVNL